MVGIFTIVKYLISNCFRFQPIDPDTLVYSNDEEDGENLPSGSEQSPNNFQLPNSSNRCSKLENRKSRIRREKNASNKELVPTITTRHENDLFVGKDLDSISPLIKRLLIDTYKNHTKQDKSKRIRASRKSRKSTNSYCVEDDVSNTRKVSSSNYDKWRSALSRNTHDNIPKYMNSGFDEHQDDIGKSYRSINQPDTIARKSSSQKTSRLSRQRSQSYEQSPHSDRSQAKSYPERPKVRTEHVCIS
jgi:hypothetical protein